MSLMSDLDVAVEEAHELVESDDYYWKDAVADVAADSFHLEGDVRFAYEEKYR